jgi:hypothetical protein
MRLFLKLVVPLLIAWFLRLLPHTLEYVVFQLWVRVRIRQLSIGIVLFVLEFTCSNQSVAQSHGSQKVNS